MGITDILDSVQYVVDGKGQQTAVQLDLNAWKALQQLLETMEDMADIEQARLENDDLFDWEDIVSEYKSKNSITPNVSD